MKIELRDVLENNKAAGFVHYYSFIKTLTKSYYKIKVGFDDGFIIREGKPVVGSNQNEIKVVDLNTKQRYIFALDKAPRLE